MSKIISLFILAILVTSCDTKKTIYVAPYLVDCEGEGQQKCMQIKENIEDEWTLFYDQIEGFDYKEGFTYKLDVNVSKIENPPADGSSLKYTLDKLIYQEASNQKEKVAQTISGNWKVEKMIGMESLATSPTLRFANGKVSGNAGCNKYNANYSVKENTISVGLTMATKMYCTNMKIEKAFFECLKKADHFSVKNGELYIYNDQNEELIHSLPEN